MTATTKCRAQNPAACTDPNCPERKAFFHSLDFTAPFAAESSAAVNRVRKQQDARVAKWLRTVNAAKEILDEIKPGQHMTTPAFMAELQKKTATDPTTAQGVFQSLLANHDLHLDMLRGVRPTTEREKAEMEEEDAEFENYQSSDD